MDPQSSHIGARCMALVEVGQAATFYSNLKTRPHLNQFERQLMQPGFQVEEEALRAQGGPGTLLPPGFQFESLGTSWSNLVLSPSNWLRGALHLDT